MKKIFALMAWRNLFYNRRKSLLAILAVAACCFSLSLFQGYISGSEVIFQDSYSQRSMLGDLIVRRSGTIHFLSADAENFLSLEEQQFVESVMGASKEVDLSVRFLRVTGSLSNGQNQAVFTGSGFDVVKGKEMRSPNWTWNTIAGTPLESDEAEEVLVGRGLGRLLGCETQVDQEFITGTGGYEPKDRPFECNTRAMQLSGVTFNGQANALPIEVRGIVDAMFQELDLRFVYMPIKLAQRLLDTDRIAFYGVRMKPGEDPRAWVNKMNEEAKRAGVNVEARLWKEDEVGEFYIKTMNFLGIFRNFMVFVILGVALLSIFNTFFRNVQERTREIGVMRTLGFRARDIRLLFLTETFYLGLIGILVGNGLAFFASMLLNRMGILYKIGLLTQPVPFLVIQTLPTLLVTSILVMAVALFAALIPLLRNEKIKITEALTHV